MSARIITGLAGLLPAGRALVGIDGYAGSGKSTLAGRLAELADGVVVCTDDFMAHASDGTWEQADIERLRREVAVPLRAGREVAYRPYDWDARRPGGLRSVPGDGLVIIEGVGALHPLLRACYDRMIWVTCSRGVAYERGLARDGVGATRQWVAWAGAEEAYVEIHRPDLAAHIVVDGAPELPHDPATEAVVLPRGG